jgi:hypothetical protein
MDVSLCAAKLSVRYPRYRPQFTGTVEAPAAVLLSASCPFEVISDVLAEPLQHVFAASND